MRLRIDDGVLDVLDEGEGTPVVLLHGFPLAKEIWDEQAAELRRRARVLRIDLRGLGASRGGPGPYLMESLASDVAGVLDARGIAAAAIVGHSLGAYVAFAFLRMFEERVLGLGLVCGRAGADPDVVRARREELATLAETQGMEPIANDYVPRFFAQATYRERPELVDSARAVVLATDPLGAAAVMRGMAMRVASDDLLEDIGVPAVVVAGRHDAFVPAGEQRAMANAIRAARFVTLESGHLPHWEQPDALTGALADLLGRIAA
jgi:3-oxoadipate enol-lactonase